MDQFAASAREALSLPLTYGVIGLRRAVCTATAVHWDSWENSLEMIAQRHPRAAAMFVQELDGASDPLHLQMAAAALLARLEGLGVPQWCP